MYSDGMWKEYELHNTLYSHWRIGELELWIRKKDEVSIAWNIFPPDSASESTASYSLSKKAPEDLLWHRFAGLLPDSILLKPTLPTLPFFVRLKTPLHILPGGETSFSVQLPLSVSICMPNGKTLIEIPLFRLSKAWFGDMESGILCYSFTSEVFPDTERQNVRATPDRTLSSLTVKSQSKGMLDINDITIYTEGLNILSRANSLYTDWMIFSFDTEGDLKLTIRDRNTYFLKDAQIVSPARYSAGETLIRKYVDFFKKI